MDKLAKAGFKQSFKENIKALKMPERDCWQRKSNPGVELDEDLSISDFKWYEDLHCVMKGRAVVLYFHAPTGQYQPRSSPYSYSHWCPQEGEDNDEEGIPLNSSAQVQMRQNEGRAPLDTMTLSGSCTATHTPSGMLDLLTEQWECPPH